MSLTKKQQMFVKEYLVDLNATQAAIRCGYSEKTAKEQAYRLFTNVHIMESVQAGMDKRSERVGVTGDRVLEEIGHSAFVDPAKFFDEHGRLLQIHDMPEEVRRSIAGIKVRKERSGEFDEDNKPIMDDITEIKVNDKTKNLELYGKHLKLFNDAPQAVFVAHSEMSMDEFKEARKKMLEDDKC